MEEKKERTFDEAFEEAKKYLDKINVCYEFETGYEFGDDSVMMFGGNQFVGVWKDPEKPTMNEFSFFDEMYNLGVSNEPINTIKLDWTK